MLVGVEDSLVVVVAAAGDMVVLSEDASAEAGSFIAREREAGGPTDMIREPNSTPIVTSCWFVKRPSQRRTVRLDLPQAESPRETILAM